jgi:Low-density lipoprotein receptor repeat class B
MTRSVVCGALATGLALLSAGCGGDRLAATGIFWAQSRHGGAEEAGSLGRAKLDGSGANYRFITGAKAPGGVAVDGRYVYWANHATGTIGRARLDGSDVNTRFIEGAFFPVGVAVDGHHIYWTTLDVDPGSGTIGRANLDGSGINQHFVKGQDPVGLAVDGHHIYWTHRYWNADFTVSHDAIGRANLDGLGVDQHFIWASNRLTGVAVTARYIFWSNSGEDTIGLANLDGTGVNQRCITAADAPLGNVPEGVAVDGRYVYWTNYPLNTVGRANLDGSGVNEHFIVVKGVPEGVAVASGRAGGSAVTCHGSSKLPILFGTRDYMSGAYAQGWGEVAPPVISNGGASASGTISQIHWSSWGGKVAVGRGLNPAFKPQGGYYRKPVVIELRASVPMRCKPGGRLVYTRFTVREQVRPGGPMGKWFGWGPEGGRNMCSSYFSHG